MTHEHIIIDSDKAFVIDTSTRSIRNSSSKLTLIQYDHNSERFGFTLPRLVEGHDMADSTSIQIHYVNTSSDNKEVNCGVYNVSDAGVDPDDDEMIIFSWLVSDDCTQHVGTLAFAIRFYCIKDNVKEYSWGTSEFSDMKITKSIFNSDVVVQKYPDVIASLEARITALENRTLVASDDENGNVTLSLD